MKKWEKRLRIIAGILFLAPSITLAQFTDDANRANELLDASANWAKLGGVGGSEMQVLSNQFALSNAAGGRRAYIAPDQADTSMYVEADIIGTIANRSASTSVQIALRYQDQDNYIGAGVGSTGNFECGIRVAGTWTAYSPTSIDLGVTAIRLEAEGNEIRCYRDVGAGWVLIHTESAVTTFNTQTDGGFISNLNAPNEPVWDNFAVGGLSAPVVAFTDDFNRADELLDASSDWDRPTAAGQNINIVGNALETGSGTGRRLYRSPDQGNANQYVQVAVPTLVNHPAPSQTQVAIRALDRLNYIGCGVNSSNNFDCGKRVADVYTSFVNTTPVSDIVGIRIEAEGTEIRSYYDIGAGWVLAATTTGVSEFLSVSRAGLVDASGTSGRPLWDDYENGILTGTAFVDWVADIEDHFNVDFFASGTTYYFNSAAVGTNTGLSNTNAFTDCSDVDGKVFAAGDQLLFLEDQATTCDVKIKNDTMVGDGVGNPFYIGVYHMSGSETPGFSGGPYSNTPGGRACLDGMDYGSYDYYGGMSNATVMAMLPTPNGGGTFSSGSLEGLLNWYQSADYDLDLYIEDICVRATGGRSFRFTQSGNAQAEWLYAKNLYIEGTMVQGFHVSGVYNFIVEDMFVTMTDAEHKYSPSTAGNTQACVAFKGTSGDPDRPVKGAFRKNAMWDSLCSEGVQSNSGGRHILIEDNVIVDAGHVAGIYLDRTNDMTVRRNFLIHTEGRTEFENNTSIYPRGFIGIHVQNEESCGSFDWCNTYNTAADFAEYAVQNAAIESNLVAGWRYNYGFLSQASGKTGNVHTGRAHGACVYFYNNMSLDADERHFTINNPAPLENYLLRTDCAQRVWGNVFYNSPAGAGGNGVDVERNDTQFETIFDANYFSSNITVKGSYDQNIVQTGLTMPLANYYNLDSYMTMDANDHMDYTNFRSFLTTMGINPDNLADKTLNLFRPTANVQSGISRSTFTYPPDETNPIGSGQQQHLDIEGNPYPSAQLFGSFAGIDAPGGGAIFRPRFQRGGILGNNKAQKLSGGLTQ
jgi:hypothetical protein